MFDLVAIEMEEIIKRYNRNTNLAINTKIVLCLYYESAGMSIFYNPKTQGRTHVLNSFAAFEHFLRISKDNKAK